MRKLLSALMVSTLVLSGCGTVRDSRLNPFNWFGGARVEPVASTAANPLIPARVGIMSSSRRPVEAIGPLAAQVSDLTVERIPGGALIRATALSDTVGAFSVKLVPLNDGAPVDGVLSYELRAFTAPAGRNPMPVSARGHVAATSLTDRQLEGVRTIRVQAERNAATTTRR